MTSNPVETARRKAPRSAEDRYLDMADRLRKDAQRWERSDETGLADDLYEAAGALQRVAEYLHDVDGSNQPPLSFSSES